MDTECTVCGGLGIVRDRYTCVCTGEPGVDLFVPDESTGPRREVDGIVFGAACLGCEIGIVINDGRNDLCGYCGCSSIRY